MILENIIAKPDIDRALATLSELTWKDGFSRDVQYCTQVKRNQELRQSDDIRLKIILTALQTTIFSNRRFSQIAFPNKIAALRFNRCANGGYYGPHADASIMNKPPIRSDLSVTLWLSDPQDYEGGELVINGMGRFKGNPGDIIVYPSYYVHEVTPVISGERICAVMWIQSMVKSAEQREMLTRMYDFGVKMKEKENLSPDYIELTSLYNNLLRMWTEL